MATTRKLLGMLSTPLTKRDAWAATFEHVFSLDAPRTDCPVHLVDAPPPTLDGTIEASLPLNELQRDIAHVHAHLAGITDEELRQSGVLSRQGHISAWMQSQVEAHKVRTQDWSDAKASSALQVVCQPSGLAGVQDDAWAATAPSTLAGRITHAKSGGVVTLSTMHLRANASKTPYCLSVAESQSRGGNGMQVMAGTVHHMVRVGRAILTHALRDTTNTQPLLHHLVSRTSSWFYPKCTHRCSHA